MRWKNETTFDDLYRLSNKYTKNYCNRTILVEVIVKDVVAFFFWDSRCTKTAGDRRRIYLLAAFALLQLVRHRQIAALSNFCLASAIFDIYITAAALSWHFLYPALMFGIEACPLKKRDINSLNFVVNRLFMKLLKTSDINIVRTCQHMFGFELPSSLR